MDCAIYTRVSTDNQAEVEFNSCEAQEAKIKSFVKSQENMEVFKVYSDAGFTGANLKRPALKEMLDDIKQNKINLNNAGENQAAAIQLMDRVGYK